MTPVGATCCPLLTPSAHDVTWEDQVPSAMAGFSGSTVLKSLIRTPSPGAGPESSRNATTNVIAQESLRGLRNVGAVTGRVNFKFQLEYAHGCHCRILISSLHFCRGGLHLDGAAIPGSSLSKASIPSLLCERHRFAECLMPLSLSSSLRRSGWGNRGVLYLLSRNGEIVDEPTKLGNL